jgi:hypothetical protein
MASIFPKVVWPAASPTTTLIFDYPPTSKPGPYGVMDQEAVGSISISISGKRQVMYLRIDQFFHLIFDASIPWASMPNWQTFMDYALQGNSFLYYPDNTGTAYDEYVIEDAGGSPRNYTTVNVSTPAWNPTMGARQLSSFELVLRKVPGGLTHA